jgi:hypothetical protein
VVLFRLANRVDIMYQADPILSPIVLLLLQSGSVHNDDEDVDIIKLVVQNAQNNYSYRMKLTPTTEDTSYSNMAMIDIVVPYQDVVMNQYDTAIIGHMSGCNDDTRKYGETKPVYSIFPTDNCNESIGNVTVTNNHDDIQYDYSSNDVTRTRSTNQLWVKNSNYSNIRCNNGDDYHNDTMRKNGERTTCYSSQDIVIDALLRVGNFNDDKAKSKFNTSCNNINGNNYWYNNNDNNSNVLFGIVITTYYAVSLLSGNLIGSHRCYLYGTRLSILTIGDGDETTTLISTAQNGENKKVDDKKRALRSEGQYKDEVYNAEEGMFQEPIPSIELLARHLPNKRDSLSRARARA